MIKQTITAIVDEVPLYGCPATIKLRNQLHSDSTLNYGEIWKVVEVIEGLRKSLREEPLSASDIDFIVDNLKEVAGATTDDFVSKMKAVFYV